MARFDWSDAEPKIREELERCRTALEAPLCIEDTATLRGKVAALRWVLGLPDAGKPEDPDKLIQPQSQTYE